MTCFFTWTILQLDQAQCWPQCPYNYSGPFLYLFPGGNTLWGVAFYCRLLGGKGRIHQKFPLHLIRRPLLLSRLWQQLQSAQQSVMKSKRASSGLTWRCQRTVCSTKTSTQRRRDLVRDGPVGLDQDKLITLGQVQLFIKLHICHTFIFHHQGQIPTLTRRRQIYITVKVTFFAG